MGMVSVLANAIKQSYKNNGVAKVVAEGGSDIAQNVISPGTPLLVEALSSAVLGAIPNAVRKIPGVSFSPSLLNRGRALVNNTARLFPGSLALAAAGNAGWNIGGLYWDGHEIKDKQNRDIAAGVLTGANGGIPAEWLPDMKWVNEGVAYANHLKNLAPPPNFSFPTNYYHSFGGY